MVLTRSSWHTCSDSLIIGDNIALICLVHDCSIWLQDHLICPVREDDLKGLLLLQSDHVHRDVVAVVWVQGRICENVRIVRILGLVVHIGPIGKPYLEGAIVSKQALYKE